MWLDVRRHFDSLQTENERGVIECGAPFEVLVRDLQDYSYPPHSSKSEETSQDVDGACYAANLSHDSGGLSTALSAMR